ncbi:MAG: RNA polymerase sigma factor [Steroidobacteraceae bacterium]
MDKSEFMRACRDGGEALERALRTLDREHFAALYRDCRRQVRDAAVARDLVQDTFIRVWQRCASFHGESELLPWIRAILRHAMLDHFRRRDPLVPCDDPMLNAAVEARAGDFAPRGIATPDEGAHDAQAAETFARCWARFEHECPAQAAVIAWIAEDGLDTEAIARLLERSPGATREYISQCRKKARVYLADWYDLAFGAPPP